MADALSVLRQFNAEKKQFEERDDLVIFGDFAWKKSAKTNYLIWGYGFLCLWTLLYKRNLCQFIILIRQIYTTCFPLVLFV